MKQIMADEDDYIDFANFELGSEGLTAIMEALMEKPRIERIDVSNNLLTDQAITFLCYYLEKSNRVQLRELDVSNNSGIGKIGYNALDGLAARYENLVIKSDWTKKKK